MWPRLGELPSSDEMEMLYTEHDFQVDLENLRVQLENLRVQLEISCRENRPISQTVFMLSIAMNRAEHVCATVIIKHNYMLMCNHKIVINIMLCLLNSTGHI